MDIQNLIQDGVEQIELCYHAPWGESRICCCTDGLEQEEEEEESRLRTVPYIHNEVDSNASTARMLLDLPRCKTNCVVLMSNQLCFNSR